MPDPNVTSAEQLDDLLREGKISQEEYETLRKAMDTAAAEEAEHRHEARPRLGRSWKNRQLGGVCAGIAERFGMEPWRIRLIFLLAFPFTGPLAPLVYLVLLIILPWNEKEESPDEWKRPWRFAGGLAALWFANLAACIYLVPYCRDIVAERGLALPSLTRFVLKIPGIFPYLRVTGFAGTLVVMGFLFGIYLTLPPDKPVRRIYAASVCAALLLLFILVGVGCALALLTIANTAR